MNWPARFLLALLALCVLVGRGDAADPQEIRVGVSQDFRPYDFVDDAGHPTGFTVELIQAVAEKMGMRVSFVTGTWDEVWNALLAGRLDALPTVARTPGREPFVDLSLPHTETFDAFFVREGQPLIRSIAAATGKKIVVSRSDAAHAELVERKFAGTLILVDTFPDGLRLVAAGRADAMLCSKLVGVLERDEAGLAGVVAGPPIPDYKREFSFAVRKGNTELLQRLNQGLALVKASGDYDKLYRKWLGVKEPPPAWETYFWQVMGILGALVLVAVTWVVARKALEADRRQSQLLTPQRGGALYAFWRYALAVLAVAAGYALRLGLVAWVGPGLPPFLTFYPVVMVSALLGGLLPGLLATVVASAIAAIGILPPAGRLVIASPVDSLGLALFFCMGVFMTAVAELHRRNRAKAAAFDRAEVLRETRLEKEFLAGLLESAEQPFAIGYPDGRLGLMNRAYEQLTGYSAAELRALDWSTVLTPPEWRDHERQRLEELQRTGQPVRYEKEYLRKDGARVPIELLVNLRRDAAGQPEFYYSFITDITARKRAESALRDSEQRFRSYFELGLIGMAVSSPSKGLLEVNDELCRMLGFERSELVKKSWAELTHPDDLGADVAQFERVMAGALDAYALDKRWIRKDGGIVHSCISVRAVRGPGGGVDHFVALVQDITERTRGEEALRDANARLQEADKHKNEFLAALSHELRNPLAPIKNSLYILDRAAPGGEQARRAQQIIDRQVTHLANLVNDLLDVTRVSRNKIQLQKEKLDLNDVVRRAAEDNRSLFERVGVHFDVVVAREPIFVQADRTRVAQVVGNLLQNAAKFTFKGGRTRVSVEAEDAMAVMRVADDGVGMSCETLAGLFQPFVQADQTLDRSKGGLGLGLALVKGLVELHGGTVSARSEGIGKGTEFAVRLPLDSGATLAPEMAQPGKPLGARRRVLVIEDNVDAADSLREALELGDHEVVVAYDGPEGLAKARVFQPEVILCDIGLPGMDGFEVARAIRVDDALKGVFLVAVSGYALPEDLRRASEAGFQRHLAKPPNLAKLEQLLAEVARGPHTGR